MPGRRDDRLDARDEVPAVRGRGWSGKGGLEETSSIQIILDSLPNSALIQTLIGDPCIDVFYTEVRSSAIMAACGSVGDKHPTILLLDSDSLEQRAIEDDFADVNAILKLRHGRTPYRLILAIPQVEAILFSDREGLEKALGRKVADLEWFEARFRPRAVLRRLLGGDDYDEKALALIDTLDDAALERMAQHEVMREIREFIAEVPEPKSRRTRIRRAG
ncbi:MAG TPA: hypothetical protein VJT67_13295 [Longimicrobiaceae bacterium]|nr:hypothetical protein [Longimicrobiaceae bacterium]